MKRMYASFLFNTFFPCVVLEVIGLMTHILPTDDYSDRITITLSCLIVMAALFTQVRIRMIKNNFHYIGIKTIVG